MHSFMIPLLLLFFSFHPYILGSDNHQLLIKIDENVSESLENQQISPDNDQPPIRLFQATNEWKEVNDEILPKGLHVRINLETGRKEAKILNDNTDEVDINSQITTSYQIAAKSSTEKIKLMTEAEDRFLRDINKLRVDKKSSGQKQFKLKIPRNISTGNIDSESEILKSLLIRYNETRNLDEKISLLIDMEFFVHKIDLGKHFYDSDGFIILMKDLSETDFNQLKIEILAVFGSAIQSNMHVKMGMSGQEFLSNISSLLENVENLDVARKCFFVLSTYLRNFPSEQSKFFISNNGKQLLRKLFDRDQRMAVKISAFLSDLSEEIKNPSSTEETIEYDFIDSQICHNIVHLLANNDLDKSDLILLLESMISLIPKCRNEFNSYDRNSMTKILQKSNFSDNEFIRETMENLLKSLSFMKDEL
ncbi:nucleotide exchange factor SIL1-like protein [Euroglyphus maynei]|uniref:Nucleotide exchange factor SIL1 n=1 Tax=Euroglyphus maynei TaxID=6958 RepID=A0A1Y3BS36_EURMA|nr:nucleotide exchange factor SIL1-like protein [Euroglyphus maynei]